MGESLASLAMDREEARPGRLKIVERRTRRLSEKEIPSGPGREISGDDGLSKSYIPIVRRLSLRSRRSMKDHSSRRGSMEQQGQVRLDKNKKGILLHCAVLPYWLETHLQAEKQK